MKKGRDIYELGLKHLGETYRLGALAPKNNSHWRGAWDCAEFASWLVFQLTAKLYGCANNNGNPATADAYTGFWKRDADRLGTIITVSQAASTKGAFLLRYSGSGIIGHIVVSSGKGTTVEAHSTKRGVIESVVSGRRWDIGILPFSKELIDYSQNEIIPVPLPKTTIYRWTTPLMKSPKIVDIQRALNKAINSKLKLDGIFGSATFHAVREFQLRKITLGLVADGEVGEKTAQALGIIL